MANYIQLRADIADELADVGSITVEQIKKAVARSIAFYTRKPWWFTEQEASFVTVPSQEYYGAAALAAIPNIIQILSAVVGGGCELIEADADQISRMQSSSTGTPTHYTIVGGNIRLYPVPNSIVTIRLLFNGPLAELSTDGDTNAWTTTAEELIRQASKCRLAADILHADDIAIRCKALETQAYDELLAENRRRRPVKTSRTDAGLRESAFNVMTG